MQKIYLCRHGETQWSKEGRHTSFTDLELTKNGICQAETLHPRLQNIDFDHIYISPLKRARQTAKLVKLSGVIHDDLVEWNYGEYEGMTTPEIQQIEPGWNIFTHGARGGESVDDVTQRADRLIQEIRKHRGNLALFSSGHFTRVFAARWIGAHASLGKHLQLATASLCILGYEHQYPTIERWNDTTHYLEIGDVHGKCAA